MRSLIILWLTCAALVSTAPAQYSEWSHSGSIWILTTAEGVSLPKSAAVNEFPVLVRLHSDFFPFPEAAKNGWDIRFSNGDNALASNGCSATTSSFPPGGSMFVPTAPTPAAAP